MPPTPENEFDAARRKSSRFGQFAKRISRLAGRPISFFVATMFIAAWGITGPLFHYSDTWQLVINTSTTVITFLMVFLIQHAQNRDAEAIQIKLDEIIRALKGAQNTMLDLEELEEDELDRIRKQYEELAELARRQMKKGDKK